MTYLYLVFLVALVAVLAYVVVEEERTSREQALAAALDHADAPLPFLPHHVPTAGSETTHPGGVCPDGASAPKTSAPGSLSQRLADRALTT